MGRKVYGMDCGLVSGFRAVPLQEEGIVLLLSKKSMFLMG